MYEFKDFDDGNCYEGLTCMVGSRPEVMGNEAHGALFLAR